MSEAVEKKDIRIRVSFFFFPKWLRSLYFFVLASLVWVRSWFVGLLIWCGV